jgi:hypothetical protein
MTDYEQILNHEISTVIQAWDNKLPSLVNNSIAKTKQQWKNIEDEHAAGIMSDEEYAALLEFYIADVRFYGNPKATSDHVHGLLQRVHVARDKLLAYYNIGRGYEHRQR